MSATAPAPELESALGRLERQFPQILVELPRGARVAVRECATQRTGTTWVLLHGISSGAASWLDCALALAHHSDAPVARVLAWDAPGYGESTRLAADAPAVDDYVERLGEALDALGVSRCILVGHSLGGLIAAAYARRHGAARVSRLILISPAGGYGAPERAGQRERVRRRRLDELTELGVAGLAERAAERLLSDGADTAARHWVRWNAARLDPAGYRQAVELLCSADLARSRPLTMPVSVYCGEADRVTPPADCAERARLFGASFSLIARAGHASTVEQATLLAAAIARDARRSTVAGIDHD